MITIPEVTKKIVKKSPFLEEALAFGIINLSALARMIRPEVEKETMKEVKTGAILMALKRLSPQFKTKSSLTKIFAGHPEMIVRSNLMELTISNTDFLIEKHIKLLKLVEEHKNYFLTVTEGVFETTIIISSELKEKAMTILDNKNIIKSIGDLSSITIKLPVKNVTTPGIYYFILKALAWDNINVVEVVSTFTEITIVLEDKDVDRAFTILKNSLIG